MRPWTFSVDDTSRRALLRRRWSLLPALAVVATLCGPAGGQSAGALGVSGSDPVTLSCVTSRPASLGGGHGNARALSSTGVAVGVADDAALRSHPVLWQNGRVTRIRTTLVGAVPVAVNKDGVVVGTAFDPHSEMPVGWYWNGKRVGS
jgi:uncharacterized membrane protein